MQIVGTDLTESILKCVEQKSKSSGGNCGITAPELARELGVEFSQVRTPLNNLVKSNGIRVRHGINGLLIFPTNERTDTTDSDLQSNESVPAGVLP